MFALALAALIMQDMKVPAGDCCPLQQLSDTRSTITDNVENARTQVADIRGQTVGKIAEYADQYLPMAFTYDKWCGSAMACASVCGCIGILFGRNMRTTDAATAQLQCMHAAPPPQAPGGHVWGAGHRHAAGHPAVGLRLHQLVKQRPWGAQAA